MFNQVILIGNLGKDPEVKHGQSGKAYCNLSVATQRYGGKKDNKAEYLTDWHNVTVFDATAEYAGKNLRKGFKVMVIGSYVTESYDKDGEKHYISKVLANKLQNLERGTGAGTATAAAGAEGAQSGPNTAEAATTVPDDDIPF